ncbi:MAG TPA: hypothetical protein VEZ47_12995, partial [Gemmatirosa sp.]|nr:hypothetical protein [Gemmatirosa sp.]
MSPLPSSRPHRAHVPAALSLVAASLLGGALAAQPTGASAAARGVDPRWQAFAGCWSPATDAAAGEPLPAGAPARCIVPAGGNAADLVSIAEGRVVARERVDA